MTTRFDCIIDINDNDSDYADDDTLDGWCSIDKINDLDVPEIADYAVTEYHRQSGLKLELVRVVHGEMQLVAGLNYRLVLEVKDGAATSTYEAVVYDRSWEHYRELTSFKRLH